jgi:hypothetical protein
MAAAEVSKPRRETGILGSPGVVRAYLVFGAACAPKWRKWGRLFPGPFPPQPFWPDNMAGRQAVHQRRALPELPAGNQPSLLAAADCGNACEFDPRDTLTDKGRIQLNIQSVLPGRPTGGDTRPTQAFWSTTDDRSGRASHDRPRTMADRGTPPTPNPPPQSAVSALLVFPRGLRVRPRPLSPFARSTSPRGCTRYSNAAG